MTVRTPINPPPADPPVPQLRHGERLTQTEFHRRYEASPEHVRAELIGGVVHMASPLGVRHAESDPELSAVFVIYKGSTPGVRTASNATTILDGQGETQPDLSLRIAPEYGGRTGMRGRYIDGPPELIAEIADTTVRLDLTGKREDYRRAGVLEYLVLCIEDRVLRAFDLAGDRELSTDADGVFRSCAFPGLWIDVAAVLTCNTARALAVVQQGLATPEHAEFVQALQARRTVP